MNAPGAAGAFLALPLGTRVVVRHRVGTSATDALGVLTRRSDTGCVVLTRRGEVSIAFADIVAAKAVPPPPVRARRAPG